MLLLGFSFMIHLTILIFFFINDMIQGSRLTKLYHRIYSVIIPQFCDNNIITLSYITKLS